jgi:DNA repair protein RecN (Recombination protein N)
LQHKLSSVAFGLLDFFKFISSLSQDAKMLANLHVRNLGIVSEAEIDFGGGLNIITGETGAGKSLLIDALSIVRGSRFVAGLIGPFGDSSSVTATFQIPAGHRVFERLAKWGLEDSCQENSIVIRRVCTSAGRTKNYVNDVPVHLRSVVELATELVDISSQFANQRLLDERSHLQYLDAFAGSNSLRGSFDSAFQSALETLAELATLRRRRSELNREKALLESEIADLDGFSPSLDDYNEIKAELVKLERMNRLLAEFGGLNSRLTDAPGGCLENLSYIERRIHQLSTSYPQEVQSRLVEQASRARAEAEELSFQMETLASTWSESTVDAEAEGAARTVGRKGSGSSGMQSLSRGYQQQLEQRINRYLELCSRFGVSVGELAGYTSQAQERLIELAGLEDRSRDLDAVVRTRMLEAVRLGRQLSGERSKVIKSLAKLVEHELASLGMPKARFIVELVPHTSLTPILLPHQETLESIRNTEESDLAEFALLSRFGFERARFLIAPNPGSAGGALRDVASGGELSRLMLSIKSVLFEDEMMSVFVFDEIDTGISGQIAAKVGQMLADFCSSRQAIVVTHLPQVACFGMRHYIVTKSVRKGQTFTQIMLADRELREQEIAKMMSGAKMTDESIAQARVLLSEAQGAKVRGASSKASRASQPAAERTAER